jgi:hypothetical protein
MGDTLIARLQQRKTARIGAAVAEASTPKSPSGPDENRVPTGDAASRTTLPIASRDLVA